MLNENKQVLHIINVFDYSSYKNIAAFMKISSSCKINEITAISTVESMLRINDARFFLTGYKG